MIAGIAEQQNAGGHDVPDGSDVLQARFSIITATTILVWSIIMINENIDAKWCF